MGSGTHTVFIALGSNVGDRWSNFLSAISMLRAGGVEVVRCSNVYETEPVGMESSLTFFNCVCQAETSHSPRSLLSLFLEIEAALGRDRSRGPDREMDLDLLFYDDIAIDEPGLTVPHPRLDQRRFVLEPWADISPGLVISQLGMSVGELLEQLPPGEWVKKTDMSPLDGLMPDGLP